MSDAIPDMQELTQAITVGGEPFFYVGIADAKKLLKRLAEVTAERDRLTEALDWAASAGVRLVRSQLEREPVTYTYGTQLLGERGNFAFDSRTPLEAIERTKKLVTEWEAAEASSPNEPSEGGEE